MSKLCPNCKEPADNTDKCACMRNLCIRCDKPVGNITFTICDECWEITEGEVKRYCRWKRDEYHDFYETDCGQAYSLIDGSLKDNHIKFCHFCGRGILADSGKEPDRTIADREILSDCVAYDKHGKVIRSGHYDDGSGSCPTCGQVFGKPPGIEQ